MHDDKFTKGMRGEFRGDFTRDTFDPLRQFSRVLMQQGRVQLDADWNEQVSILLYYFRKLGADLMGPHGAPRTVDGVPGEGFKIIANGSTFDIGPGHYYVNGILCENDDENLTFRIQPDLPFTPDELEESLAEGDYLVYLDVWERHISYVEDDYMREKALGGPGTATRAKVVVQVKVKKDVQITKNTPYDEFLQSLADEKKPGSGQLRARARKTPDDNKDPCLTSPEASYRGAENQLYRVEIHKNSAAEGGPTFKWSRENGSVIFPIMDINGTVVTLEHLGRDSRFGLKPNDWIEIVDDDYILRNRADALLQIEEIDPDNLQVILKKAPEPPFEANREKHPYLRRWDQKDNDSNGVSNGISVVEGDTEQDWILLEDGVEIQFPTPDDGNVYQTGDYWLIPARTASDVEWPGPVDAPHALPPQGVEHHYAPLRNITVDNSNVAVVGDLRRKLKKNWD